ncbi:MAG: hypothetical protein KDA44_07540 [Planctomycetales bacterium]|nr:hypothetical protein [Planctomycetales bacterium]
MRGSPASAEGIDHVCTACGLLCDDVRVRTRGSEVIAVEPPCPVAARVLCASRPRPAAACLIDGQAADYDDALAAAAKILSAARMPLITGLNRATVETVQAACEMADRLRGTIAPLGPHELGADFTAPQTVGAVTATLGEISARADLIVSWFADPVATHPRLRERLGAERRIGSSAPGKSRAWLAVDSQTTATTEAADAAWLVKADAACEAAAVLRGLLTGRRLDATRVEQSTGVTLAMWHELADKLAAADYAALLFDEAALRRQLSNTPLAVATTALAELIESLHMHTRGVSLPLTGAGNATGAAQTLLWQTGYPAAVTFAGGSPEYRPHEANAETLLTRGEADALLVVGSDLLGEISGLAQEARAALRGLPVIALDDAATATMGAARVAFATRRFETEESGSVFRTDGVALPLAAAVKSTARSAEQILRDLAKLLPA